MKKNINFNGNSIRIDNIKENYYIIKKLKNGYEKEREIHNVFLFNDFHVLKLTEVGHSNDLSFFMANIECFNSIFINTFELGVRLYHTIYIYKYKENMLKL